MTPPHDQPQPDEDDRELTPDEDARLRALLASARADEAIPDDVAARLDATLAGLQDERAGTLARARRQRRGRWVLGLAAAAVVAVAVAQLPRLGGANDAGGSSSADSAASGAAPKAGSAESGGGGGSAATYALRSKTFRADVRRLLDGYSSQRMEVAPNAPDVSAGAACAPSADTGTRQQLVVLDGKPAVLEVRRSRDGSRLVRAVSCDGDQTLASTRIPAP